MQPSRTAPTGSLAGAPPADVSSRRVRPWLILHVGILGSALTILAPRILGASAERFVAICRMHVPSHQYASGNIDLTVIDACLYLLAIVSASALLLDRWPRRWLQRAYARVAMVSDRFFLSCVFAFVLAAALLISWRVFGHFPRDVDHIARVFQAHTLASGKLQVSAPPVPAAFEAYGVVERDGQWFAKYEPGGAVAMALWLKAFGVTWGIHPLFGALIPLLVFGALRQWYDGSVARLATVLIAVSPFFLFMVSSFHSHVPCLFFLSAYLFFISRSQRTTGLAGPFLAGLFAGLAFTTRTYSTLLVAWPFALWLLLGQRRWSGLRTFAALAAGAALPLAALLAYNTILTGDPLLFPFHLADPDQKPWFGYKDHTAVVGLIHTIATLKLLNLSLFGWPASLFFVAVLLLLRKQTADRAFLASSASLMAGYAAYYWSDFSNGPRYVFEALPALAVLTARGILAFPELIDRLKIADVDRGRAADFATAVVGVSFVFCVTLYLPPLARMYGFHYNANFDLKLDALAREQRLDHALVFIEPLPGQNRGFGAGFLANPLDLRAAARAGSDANVIYARDRGRRANRRVIAAYPGRSIYSLSFDPVADRTTLTAEPPTHG